VPYDALPIGADFIGDWEEDEFSFLFFHRPSDSFIENLLNKLPGIQLMDTYCMPYEDWHGNKITSFHAGRFWITPPWEDNPHEKESPDNLHILLDPGVVFGTGTHPTTNDCLEALVSLCYGETIHTVLDLGTGTGLLAIAAAKLQCRPELAVDFNFLAATTARNNVKLNGLENNILVVQGMAEELLDKPVDLMISNIHYDVMKNLTQLKGFLNSRFFILSGLLRSEAGNVKDQLNRLPITVLNIWERDGIWHTMLGKTNNP
jgi:ribosomal protein L11 methyltransferase